MTLPGEITTEAPSTGASAVHLRVLATSDLHAHLLPFDYFTDRRSHGFGLARLATVIAAARAAACNSILVDNGDTLQGAPLADAAVDRIVPAGRTHPMIAAMNAMGYDAATLGNHDFDFGVDFLDTTLARAGFPVVLANAHRSDGAAFLPTRRILEREVLDSSGVTHVLKIGITGIVPPQVEIWNKPQLAGRLTFVDNLCCAKREVAALKAEGADIVIVLAHSGLGKLQGDERSENVARLIGRVPGVDAVIAGHTHLVYPEGPPGPVDDVPIVQPGAFGTHLGCIDLALRAPKPEQDGLPRNEGWSVMRARAGNFATNRPIPERRKVIRRILPDFPELRDTIARDHKDTRQYAARPLGATATPIETYFSTLAPCAATQLIAEAQLAAARPILAARTDLAHLPLLSAAAPFKAGGRAGPESYTDVPVGPMKLRHAADLYIYPYRLSVLKITGRGLRDWLERSASIYRQIDPEAVEPQDLIAPDFAPYNFDSILGLRYQIDVSRPARTDAEGTHLFDTDGRIRDLSFADGRPVQDTDEALVVTNSYRAGGGGHMNAAASAEEVIFSHFSVRDVIARYVSDAPGAITVVPEPTWSLRPLGGVRVLFQTGPGALAHRDRIEELELRQSGPLASDSFVKFTCAL